MIAYLKLFRFPLVFTAIADSAAGYLVVLIPNGASPDPRTLACLAIASAGLYFFGMVMNDIADRERDKVIAPNRVLPSGRVSLAGAAGASVFVIVVSAAAVLLMPLRENQRFIAWGATLGCIVVYDFFLKFPPVMGLVRAGNFLLGVVCFDLPRAPFGYTPVMLSDYTPYLVLAVAPLVYGTALTFVSTLEEGQTDRRKVIVGALLMAFGAIFPVLVRIPVFHPMVLWGLLPGVLLIGWIAWRSARAIDRKGIMLMVRDGIAGFILLDSVQLAACGRPLEAAAIAGLLIPAALAVAGFKKLA